MTHGSDAMCTGLDASWFHDVRRMGVTAGASTPHEVVDQMLDRVRQLSTSRP